MCTVQRVNKMLTLNMDAGGKRTRGICLGGIVAGCAHALECSMIQE